MEYKAKTCVWEITVACNMRCKHCGSSCTNASEDELTTEEALDACRQMGEIGVEWVTLSGGEPTTRKDWNIIAKGLTDNGIIPSMITNAWLLDEDLIEKAEKSGINTIAISIDGNNNTHDFIRKPGAFERALKGLDLIRQSSYLHSAVITTVNSENITELNEMKEIFIEHGVENWQIQFGLPMGNMSHNKDLVISPAVVDKIIEFAYEIMQEGKINIDLADCVGYFNLKEIKIRQQSLKNRNNEDFDGYSWSGCGAGKVGFGLLNNGDVVGCTSIRSKEFIEGNIKKQPLKEIWNSDNNFNWNREMKKEKLEGKCKKCLYGQVCKGGCSNSRLTMNGTVYSENKYCSYNYALTRAESSLKTVDDVALLLKKADKFISSNNLQLGEIALSLANDKKTNDIDILNKLAYVNYKMQNFEYSKQLNEKILELDSNNCYSTKGLGLCLIELEEIEEGLRYLYKSIELVDGSYLDPYYDLAITLLNLGKVDEAKNIINEAEKKYSDFKCLKNKFIRELEAYTK